MRVLQLAPVWETVPPPAYGGTEAVVHVLTEELVRRGVDVTLCASGDSETSARLVSFVPQSLRSAGLCQDGLPHTLLHVAMSLREAGEYDIVHSHNGPPPEVGMALSHLVSTPFLTTLHNQLAPDTRFIWNAYAGWYNTISVSQERRVPCMPRACYAGPVHNGIDVQSFPFEGEKDDYLLFIGRMTDDKAPHLAARVARKLGMPLIIAGKMAMPEEFEYYHRALEPLVDGDLVQYIGEVDARTKRHLYRHARCLLAPLQWDEPFGLVMVEAMACGTPVIAFPRGAAPEIVSHKETGMLVTDVEEMADAVKSIGAIDPHRCREVTEERFGPAALADRYMSVYQRIIQESRGD